ncbi:hypothetical protein TRVA0_007S03598 [Trichomonascus vanleenenianus]|uniref:J domain-containing protein n=1 Tax=Trichomonascus vanleenenianus TaxID=2268995 RepID=UPI003ECA71A0
MDFLIWIFFPLIVSTIQSGIYSLVYSNQRPAPAKNSPKYIVHNRTIHVLLIVGYLCYCTYKSYSRIVTPKTEAEATFYELFEIAPDAPLKAVKKAFRKMSLIYHPDKVGKEGAKRWMGYKNVYDVLQSPTLRYGYDRFGTAIFQLAAPATKDGGVSEAVVTMRQVIQGGLLDRITSFYGPALIGTFILYMINLGATGTYWRIYMLAAGFTIEALVATHASVRLVPFLDLLPFQETQLMRDFIWTIGTGLTQLGPVASALAEPAELAGDVLIRELEVLHKYAALIASNSKLAIRLASEPYLMPNKRVSPRVQNVCQKYAVEAAMQADPVVQQAFREEKKKE